MRRLLVACTLTGVASCNSERQAGLVVDIPSDMSRADINQVHLEVVHPTRGTVVEYSVTVTKTQPFPLEIGVGPSQSSKEGPYLFRVIGSLNGQGKTLREAVTDVPRVGVRRLPMPVEFLCYDKVKVLADGRIASACGEGLTCIAGECKPIPTYATEELPVPAPRATSGDAGAESYDVPQCFRSYTTLPPDLTTCRVARPRTDQNFTMALLLPPEGPGVPFGDKKLVLFDQDGDSAFKDQGAELEIPRGTCQYLREHVEAVLVASTTCTKTRGMQIRADSDGGARDAGNYDGAVSDVADMREADSDADERSADTAGEARDADAMMPDVSADAPLPDVVFVDDVTVDSRDASVIDAPDAPMPADTSVHQPGECMTSSGGMAEAGAPCDGGMCNGAGQCGLCRPDARECSGTTPRTCNAQGQWVAGQPCALGCDVGVCVDQCTVGRKRCLRDTPQVCTPAGTWQSAPACPHGCTGDGVCEQGNLVCWGNNLDRRLEAPVGTFIDVSADYNGSCAVRADGIVVCWGLETDNRADKSGLYASVSAGAGHYCGVRTDGTVHCWGDATHTAIRPSPGTFTSISAGDYYVCGVRTNGSVNCWGGEWLPGATDVPSGNFMAVSAGEHHTCGLRVDGTVTCWGANDHNELAVSQSTFTWIDAGTRHSCGVRTNGTLECWGGDVRQAEIPSGTFVSVSAGRGHSCAVRTDRTAICWGNNDRGQTGAPPDRFVYVSAGGSHSCGILRAAVTP